MRNDERDYGVVLPMSDPIKDYAMAVAEAVLCEVRYIAKDAYREFPWDEMDRIIASVPAPDVQAQECRAEAADGERLCHHVALFCDYHARENVQAQIDAAVAREREECARECERIAGGKGMSAAAFSARVCASNIRARSAKGES